MASSAEHVEVEVAGRTLAISSPDKVFFKERGETKLDHVRYVIDLAEPLLRAIGGRPILMERYPDGASGKSFFQKRVPKGAPDWLQTCVVATVNGTESDALVAVDVAHLVWAVNMGCLGFHAWPTPADDMAHADELRIDLDPSPGVTFAMVRETAVEARDAADRARPDAVREDHRPARHPHLLPARAAAGTPTRCAPPPWRWRGSWSAAGPELCTWAWWKEERGARVFVDYNQNAPHKTVFSAWGARPRVGGQVSTPFAWDEIETVEPDELTIATVPARVAEQGDPWTTIVDTADDLSLAARALGRRPRERDDGRAVAAGVPEEPNEPPRVAPSRARKPDA